MPERKTIQEYLEIVEEQIRWKRARPVVSLELQRHLEDQRDAFAEAGTVPEEAERLAVEEMGDPVTVGTELDRVHRPRPQWGLLALTVLLALCGGFLRVWLFAGSEHLGSGLAQTALSLALGTACLLGAYFLDVSFLGRYGKAVYVAAIAVGLLSLWLSPRWNNVSYYTRYVALCYPVVYAVWLYVCRGKGWKGVFLAISGGVPLAAVCALTPFAMGLFLLLSVGLLLLLAAAGMDWFGVGRLPTAGAAGGCAVVLSAAVFRIGWNDYFAQRVRIAFHPELDPMRMGYQGMLNRLALSGAKWLGEGTMPRQYVQYPYEVAVPDADHSMIPLTIIFKLGWLPFLLLMLALAALLIWLLCRCLRQKSQLGRMTVLAVVLTLGFQLLFSLAINSGVVLFSAEMPLLVGNLHTVLDMALIGLALSVFRGSSIAREDGERERPVLRTVPRIRIAFQHERDTQNGGCVLGISLIFSKDETKMMESSSI